MRIFLGPIRLALAGVVVAAVMVACSDDGTEITVEQRLERIAGEDLTPADVERRLQVATTLCSSDRQILELIWSSMSAQQLRFQDFVFGTHCPERSVEYAIATGRSLTAEAHTALATGAGSTIDTEFGVDPPPTGSTPSTLALPSSTTNDS